MIKICSLDFLNRETFDMDIMTKDGMIIHSAGEKITPEILLNLYFKEIFVNKELYEQEDPIQEQTTNINIEQSIEDVINLEIKNPIIEETVIKEEEPKEKEELGIKLEFDEAHAKRVSEYSTKLGKLIGMPEEKLKELEQAAYYHKIGCKTLYNTDLSKPDFKILQAEAGYKILLHEMNFSEKIAEVTKQYLKKYDSNSFRLEKETPFKIPYAHIVAIANYYDEAISDNIAKENVLDKMLQLGGGKFNIFVLHKFINMMR